METYFSCF
jgi:hypothetical protein